MMYQDIYICICQNTKKDDIVSIISNLQSNCCLKIDFQKVDRHAVWYYNKMDEEL